MTPWFRWHDGTVRDGKFQIAAKIAELPVCTVIGVWASLLEDASTSDPRGVTSRGVDYHSLFLNISSDEIGTVWNALERVGVIKSVDTHFAIVQWQKRQFETDVKDPTAAARKDKWKQRHKKNGTARNGLERFGTPDTDSDTEKKDSCSNEFERFWKAYPRRIGKKVAEKALAKALRETSIETITGALARQIPLWTEPKFIPHPATWLNAGRWADDLPEFKPSVVVSEDELARLRARYDEKVKRSL